MKAEEGARQTAGVGEGESAACTLRAGASRKQPAPSRTAQTQTPPAPGARTGPQSEAGGLGTPTRPATLPREQDTPGRSGAEAPARGGGASGRLPNERRSQRPRGPMSGGASGPAAQWRRRVGTLGAGGRARRFQKTGRAPRGQAEPALLFPSSAGSTMAAVKSLNPKAEVARAQAALAVNISAARGLQDVLRTNLGPKGTMKM